MKKYLLLLSVLLMTGCSTTFAYNNASWLVYWYLDDYVELNSSQEEQFDQMLAQWMSWHRSQELPKYEAQLGEIIEDIKSKNINHERITYHREKVRAHWVRARECIADDLVTLGRTLDEDQIIYMFAALEKENTESEEEIAERNEKSKKEREKDWVKQNQKGMRRWMGRLSNEQKDFIAGFNTSFESTSDLWLGYRLSLIHI